MKRTNDLRSGLKAAAMVVFFAAAAVSTGCSNNALMNPQIPQSTQSVQTANAAGNNVNPAGNNVNP